MRYLHLDVFTGTPLEGNQLAVFPDPPLLDTALMQRIAREMAFSETTFIYPPEQQGDVRMRIFTPGTELPIAGHPTIGSTYALALERTIDRGRAEFVFELGVGPTPVLLDWGGDELRFVWMTQPLPAFGPVIDDRASVARACGLRTSDLADGLPAQLVSCGVPYLLVPLATRAAVDAAAVDRQAFAACCRSAGIEETPGFFFTTEDGDDDAATYSRMIGFGFGIPEDPATGSAAGPLGSYLVHHRVVTAEEARAMVNRQGVAMGRPSRIHMSIDSGASGVTRVRVGGQAVLVGRGELIL